MASSLTYLPVRTEGLQQRHEDAIEPALPVVDAHHHLYHRPECRYLLEDFLQDLAGGHDVRATVFVQARAMLRADAPPQLQPLGETEFVNGVAAMSASGTYGSTQVCAAIVGYADFRLGDAARPLLERHIAVAGGAAADGGRFRGVRHSLTWDADSSLMNPVYPITRDLMDSREFRAAFAHLSPLGLSFEAWVFFHQLSQLTRLARAFPDTPIVLNHCGGILGIGSYAGRRDEVFQRWKAGLLELAACPNVMVKLSGLGMALGGFDFHRRALPPSSAELASAWQPWVETCLQAFGAARCMYGSNFPVDKGSYGHAIGLNALKRLLSTASADERADVFWRSAKRFYRLSDASLGLPA